MKNIVNQAPQIICTIDDDESFSSTLSDILKKEKYTVYPFHSADSFLVWLENSENTCDLIVTDITMPGLSGYELCLKIRARQTSQRIPIIMVSGNIDENGKVAGLSNGADDFIQKPFAKNELLAKIQSLLKIRIHETERLKRMSRFVSPNVADILLSDDKHFILEPHQAIITVLFIDLRGFTAFSETTTPEQTLGVLNEFYTIVGRATIKHAATFGNMSGDGFMLFLNDPQPIDSHQEIAIKMAIELRENMLPLVESWKLAGYELDFGIGLAEGLATIGGIGFDQFWQYTVIGPVANFASRICQMADKGQILISHRFLVRLGKNCVETQALGPTQLKGFKKVVDIYNVLSTK